MCTFQELPVEASSSLLSLAENLTHHSQDMIPAANQISTPAVSITDTDLQPLGLDMMPSTDPGNDFTTHGYLSPPPEVVSSSTCIRATQSHSVGLLYGINLRR